MLVFKYLPRLAYLALITFVTSSLNVASAAPAITLDGPMAELFSIKNNTNSSYAGDRKYGAWVDGPANPYKYGGNTYFQIPHSEIFRIKVPGNDWGNPAAWTMEGVPGGASITPTQRDTIESHYNNRNWIFSVYAESGMLYGMTHHEWYRCFLQTTPAGFNCDDNANNWIASIGWANSSDGGSTWSMRPVSEGASRLIVAPEPSSVTPNYSTYGFMHPSNVVKEGNYYYVFTSTFNYGHDDGQKRHGVALFRTDNISNPVGWQFWNGNGWTVVDHNVYQGNFGPQMPHVFWPREDACSHLYAMNVRKHRESGKWIVLGSKYCLAGPPYQYQAVFSWVNNLDNPRGLENNWNVVQQNGQSLLSNNYYSFFDVDGRADDNYQSIGDSPLLVVTSGQDTFYSQHITLTGFVDLPNPNVILPAVIIDLLVD